MEPGIGPVKITLEDFKDTFSRMPESLYEFDEWADACLKDVLGIDWKKVFDEGKQMLEEKQAKEKKLVCPDCGCAQFEQNIIETSQVELFKSGDSVREEVDPLELFEGEPRFACTHCYKKLDEEDLKERPIK